MKKLFTLLTTAAMLCNMFAVTSFAEESDKPTSNIAPATKPQMMEI